MRAITRPVAIAGLAGLCVALSLCQPGFANGAELIINGGFESNNGVNTSVFSNWSVVRENADGSVVGNFYVQSGTRSPKFQLDVPSPYGGAFAAMTDQSGPGRTAIYQDIAVPATGAVWLNLRLLIVNQADDFLPAATLSLSEPGNQQVRVDVIDPLASVWDTASGVLANAYISQPGDRTKGTTYVPMAVDLSALAGRTVRIRIAEVDTVHGLVVGVDQASVTHVPVATCPPVRPREGTATCSLDADGDGLLTATDALLVTRYLLGFRGNRLVQGVAANACALNTSAASLEAAMFPLLASSPPVIDIDGDGTASGTTDGLMLLRAMLGLTGTAATSGAVSTSPGVKRSDWPTVRHYLNTSCLSGLPG